MSVIFNSSSCEGRMWEASDGSGLGSATLLQSARGNNGLYYAAGLRGSAMSEVYRWELRVPCLRGAMLRGPHVVLSAMNQSALGSIFALDPSPYKNSASGSHVRQLCWPFAAVVFKTGAFGCGFHPGTCAVVTCFCS